MLLSVHQDGCFSNLHCRMWCIAAPQSSKIIRKTFPIMSQRCCIRYTGSFWMPLRNVTLLSRIQCTRSAAFSCLFTCLLRCFTRLKTSNSLHSSCRLAWRSGSRCGSLHSRRYRAWALLSNLVWSLMRKVCDQRVVIFCCNLIVRSMSHSIFTLTCFTHRYHQIWKNPHPTNNLCYRATFEMIIVYRWWPSQPR